jgi:hypothetical protein
LILLPASAQAKPGGTNKLKQRRLIEILRVEQPIFETLPELLEKLKR